MSSSVTISVATNSVIALSKGFGWFVTGSPTLFAETVHSLADVGNQVLLKVGEVRGREGPDAEHPFGHAQEKFFWALVSAVSVFFIGCGINLYHGVHALLDPTAVEPFSALVIGLLIFALALESWTFSVALKEIGGWRGARENRHNITVLAVLLEDSVALFGILLTLLVAAAGHLLGPNPVFDAWVAIVVGVLLGVMALILAAINRSVLIDASDRELDAAVTHFLAERDIAATAHSLVLDNDRAVVFVHAPHEIAATAEVAAALKARMLALHQKTVDEVYWRFAPASAAAVTATAHG
jgi:solute carrier family 30 (zinc transporter), member 9